MTGQRESGRQCTEHLLITLDISKEDQNEESAYLKREVIQRNSRTNKPAAFQAMSVSDASNTT